MSANETAPAGSASARGADASGAATARLIEGEVAEDAGVGVIVPATTRPTRKATVAERHTLTARNRRVIVFYYCIEVRLKPTLRTVGVVDQLDERGLVERGHAKLAGFLRLTAGVGAHNHRGGFFAHRPGDLSSKPLDR